VLSKNRQKILRRANEKLFTDINLVQDRILQLTAKYNNSLLFTKVAVKSIGTIVLEPSNFHNTEGRIFEVRLHPTIRDP
jgi:hypothetical protein